MQILTSALDLRDRFTDQATLKALHVGMLDQPIKIHLDGG